MIRVLFVNNEKTMLDPTKTFLEGLNRDFTVDVVSSAEEAFQNLSEEEYDIVVADCQLLVTSGLEFLSWLRKQGSDIPLILFASRGQEEIAVEILGERADGYIIKSGEPTSQYVALANSIRQLVTQRKAETSLRESEEKYRTLVALAHDGIILVEGQERTISLANPRMCEMLGYTVEELVGKKYPDLVHPDDMEDYLQVRRSRVTSGSARSIERRLLKKDGSTLHVLVSASNLDPKDRSESSSTIGIFTDITQWKRTEEELRQAERRLRDIVENLGAGLAIYDENFVFTYANLTLARMLGYAPDELIGRPVSLLIHEDSLAERNREIKKRRRGESSSYETSLLSKDGRTVPVLAMGTPIFDDNKEFMGSYSLIIDLTERKKTEKKLRDSEERYRSLVELANDGIILVGGSERVISYVNDRFAEMLGYNVDELVGRSYTDLIHPEERKEYLTTRMSRLMSGKAATHERRLVRKDGSTLHTIISVSSIDPNDKTESAPSIAIFTDITQRKKAEEGLRKSEERYRSLIETAHDGIIITEGPERAISLANPRMCEMLGYTADELRGKTFVDLVHPDDMECYLQDRKALFTSGRASTYDRLFLKKDGSTLHVLVSVSPVNPDDRTESAPATCIITDITERRKMEDRERFLHSLLRHDLKNKFQGVYGYLELIRRSGLSEKQGEYVESLRESFQGAVELIDKVQGLRMVEETKEIVNVDLNLVISDAIEAASIRAEEQGVAIDYKGIPGAVVRASPLLANVFTNLIDNSVIHADCRKISIAVREIEDRYRITVRDDGKGLPESVRGGLFERGVKGPGSSGSGLGLHLVKRIIETSDGTITLKDTKKGTCFEIYLNRVGFLR